MNVHLMTSSSTRNKASETVYSLVEKQTCHILPLPSCILLNCFFSSGIGSFTIVDGQKVTGEDVGNKYVHSNKVEHNLVTHNIMMHSVNFLQQFSLSYM